MDACPFDPFLSRIAELTRNQCMDLLERLKVILGQGRAAGIMEAVVADTRPSRKRGGKESKRGISGEQVCIFVARDRSGKTCDFATGRGPFTGLQLSLHLTPLLAVDTLLVTDVNMAYRNFARQTGITREDVNVSEGERLRGAIHLQTWHASGYRIRG